MIGTRASRIWVQEIPDAPDARFAGGVQEIPDAPDARFAGGVQEIPDARGPRFAPPGSGNENPPPDGPEGDLTELLFALTSG
jgi:hypothetical protein